MLRELGYCSGVENYSRHLSQREPGSRPWTLLDYFPPDWLLIVDESHMTIPQVVGMYKNDRTRKEILVDFGFRLPSALDNRPLTFEEFEVHVNQAIYVSATPGPYEHEKSQQTVEQLIRPTGIVDPPITVRPTEGQIDDLLEEIRTRVERGERALVTTLTKKMVGGPGRLPQGAGRQGPVPALRGRHARAGRDPARPAARRVRRAGRDQPAPRRPRPARGDDGRDPRRGQGGVPAQRLVADPDDRPRGPQHGRRGDHVRRHRDRVDEGRDRGDRPAARDPDALQRGARDRADDDRQEHPGHQRPAAGGRGENDRVLLRAPRRAARGGRPGGGGAPGRPDGGRDEAGRQGARVRARGGDPRRDPADPAPGPRAGRVGGRGAGRRARRQGRRAAGEGAGRRAPSGRQGRPRPRRGARSR